MVCTVNSLIKMYVFLAISNYPLVKEDNIRLLSFLGNESHEFIDVCAIDHCVGFIKIN